MNRRISTRWIPWTLLAGLLCPSPSVIRAQVDEEEVTSVGVRFDVREALGRKGIPREQFLEAFAEYGLLPMISLRGGLEVAAYEIPPEGASAAQPQEVDEAVISATVRYYKARGRVRFFGSFGVGLFLEEREGGNEKIRDADLGLLLGAGLEFTLARHFGLELETLLESSGGGEPDSVLVFAVGPKFFF